METTYLARAMNTTELQYQRGGRERQVEKKQTDKLCVMRWDSHSAQKCTKVTGVLAGVLVFLCGCKKVTQQTHLSGETFGGD